MFSHMDSIKEFKKSISNWRFVTIAFIIIGVREIRDSKGGKQLLIVNTKGEFNQDILTFGNNFRAKYE